MSILILCIDESGNTNKIIALGLVAIPDISLEYINQLFTLRPNDPQEIKTLYNRIPKGNLKPREEFKYSDLVNAYNATSLVVYYEFLKQKLQSLKSANLEVYLTAFDNPQNNEKRLKTLDVEAQILIHEWAKNNLKEALKSELQITVDQQVFSDRQTRIFQVYERRNKWYFEIFHKNRIAGIRHYGGTEKENHIDIIERSSKTFKPLQVSDFVVGAFRESLRYNNGEIFDILKTVAKTTWTRDARGTYAIPKDLRFI